MEASLSGAEAERKSGCDLQLTQAERSGGGFQNEAGEVEHGEEGIADRVALEELVKPNQGERFKWRRVWVALRLSE